MLNDSRPLSSGDCIGCVARALKLEGSEPEAEAATLRVIRQMVHQDGLAVFTYSAEGTLLILHPDLLETAGNDAWAAIARIPKAAVVLVIALLWIISPIDLIPDAIPVIGILDDISVALLGFEILRRGAFEKKPKSDRFLDVSKK